ncbi:MAG TPA: NfeD family protein [Gemmatimonadaceae bacterium]|jgi:membrane protein implicated in regulation of membrane protease activity
MTILYLASFIGGLMLAVGVMIFGVERPRERSRNGERSFRLSPAPTGVFAVVFGVVGYVLSRRAFAGLTTTLIIAALCGVIAAVITARLVRQWWAVTPEHEVEDERYVFQGHLARVTKPIAPDVDGEVAFEVDQEQRVLRARNFEEGALPAGTDVVIERIEDDVAYVEAWQEVEKRL